MRKVLVLVFVVIVLFIALPRAEKVEPSLKLAPAPEELQSAIKSSDDFEVHHSAFTTASEQLIMEGRCSLGELVEYGGWVKSVTNYREQPVYFTYCGGSTVANRIYLNVETGIIF